MSLEREIRGVIESAPGDDHLRLRDTEAAVYYYGLAGKVRPTLEETAKRFGIGTKERTRQILDKKFRAIARERLPAVLQRCREFVASRSICMASDLMLTLKDDVPSDYHPDDLLRLLHELDLVTDVSLLAPDGDDITRSNSARYSDHLLVNDARRGEFEALTLAVKKLPARHGAAPLTDVPCGALPRHLVKRILVAIPDAWASEHAGETWFLLQSRQNALINALRKTFHRGGSCDVERLALTLHNALLRRSPESGRQYPPVEVIESYLTSSIHTSVTNGAVRYIGASAGISPIETATSDYLANSGEASFPEIRSYLEGLGFNEASIVKAINNSPIVYVDRTLKRKSYRYSLAVDLTADTQPLLNKPDRHRQFNEMLKQLALNGTDADVESTRRREQSLLKEWLFGEVDVPHCAVCGREFERSALACAHKKPRSACSELERTDPYIVMPLCMFGCHYLYDEGMCRIVKGRVERGSVVPAKGFAIEALEAVVGRIVDPQWLRGSADYFRRLTSES